MGNLSKYIAAVLISVLAFSQVGLNFFHSEHLEHGHVKVAFKQAPAGDEVQQHDEHCKVCSVDFFGKLYTKPAFISLPDYFEGESFLTFTAHFTSSVSFFVQSRGPPSRS